MYQHVCMFWFRMNNICDNWQALIDEKFSETGKEINKAIVTTKKLSQIPGHCLGRLSNTSNCFSLLQTSPLCLFCVSGIHRERNHGSTRSTRLIMSQERTAICKSQLELIIENPGNKWGEELAFGGRSADRLYRGLVCLQCMLGPY